jgi:hypothetical protein
MGAGVFGHSTNAACCLAAYRPGCCKRSTAQLFRIGAPGQSRTGYQTFARSGPEPSSLALIATFRQPTSTGCFLAHPRRGHLAIRPGWMIALGPEALRQVRQVRAGKLHGHAQSNADGRAVKTLARTGLSSTRSYRSRWRAGSTRPALSADALLVRGATERRPLRRHGDDRHRAPSPLLSMVRSEAILLPQAQETNRPFMPTSIALCSDVGPLALQDQ